MQRREFLLGAAAAASAAAAPSPGRFLKSICSIICPDEMPVEEKFRAVKDAGFDGIELRFGREVPRTATLSDAARIGDAARKAGVQIASMWVSEAFARNRLNSPDPEERARGVAALRHAISLAPGLGCGALLLYTARLGSGAKLQTGYEDTWNRVTECLRAALPDAEKARVLLTPENVWSKFILSPVEMRQFVDQFKSPWLQTHFDIGNVMQYGYPEDWILTLGSRIKRVHVKDYKLSARAEQGRFVDLLEGDVDFKAVMSALVRTGYHGFLSPEISHDPADPAKIRKVSAALDQILAMA